MNNSLLLENFIVDSSPYDIQTVTLIANELFHHINNPLFREYIDRPFDPKKSTLIKINENYIHDIK